MLFDSGSATAASPDSFREFNQSVYDAMRRFPGRVLGDCFVNPGYDNDAIDEARRCVEDRGFAGIKLYNDYMISEPVVRPLIELATKLRVPIIQHAGHVTWLSASQPRIRDGRSVKLLSRGICDDGQPHEGQYLGASVGLCSRTR